MTADSSSGWRCIYDHVSIYSAFSGLTEKPPIPDDNELPDDETLDDADGNADDGSLTDLDDISGPDELNEPDEAGTESAPDRPSGGNSTQKNKIPVTNEITGN